MKKLSVLLTALLCAFGVAHSHAAVLTSIPGPDAQGGMIMPMVLLNEGTKTLSVMMDPYTPPLLAPLTYWKPGDSFDPADAWYELLNPTPEGAGALFSSRFGFVSMSVTLPVDLSLAIKLTSLSSNLLGAYNYIDSSEVFDSVFVGIGGQVLWDGSMWHTVFTLPANAPAGTYTASFEVFVADMAFTDGTGYVDYSAGALTATRNMDYNTVTIDYVWTVVPEPSTYLLLGCAAMVCGFAQWRRRKVAAN